MNTVKTRQRHLYRKLDARTRSGAVERARALGASDSLWRAPVTEIFEYIALALMDI